MTPRRHIIDATALLAGLHSVLGYSNSLAENLKVFESWLTATDPQGRRKGVQRGAPS
jgi:hypothetical protein